MDEWQLEDYETDTGRLPVAEFLEGLTDERATREAAALLLLLRERGNTLRSPKSEALGEGLFELRGHQVRIFYVFRPGRRIVLLDGIVKKQDRIPRDVLTRVRQYQAAVGAADRRRAP